MSAKPKKFNTANLDRSVRRNMTLVPGLALDTSVVTPPETAEVSEAEVGAEIGLEAEVDRRYVITVPLSRLVDNPYNARHLYPQERLDELVESIKSEGQLSPVHGFRLESKEGFWQLIDGQFRKRALIQAGKDTIDLLPVKPIQAFELYRISFLLNEERSEQTAFDNAVSWRKLLDDRLVVDQDALAEQLGVSKAHVSKTLNLLDLPPEVLQLVKSRADVIGSAMGYQLYQFANTAGNTTDDVKALFWRIVDEGLSTRQVEAIRATTKESTPPRAREHSTTYPIKFSNGVRGSFKEWAGQGRLSMDLRHLSEEQRVSLRESFLRILGEVTK